LLLAYTNRFAILAQILRSFRRTLASDQHPNIQRQLDNLKFRVNLIRWMQAMGIIAFIACTASMLFLYIGLHTAGSLLFGLSLLLLCISLLISLWEIHISVRAINIELEDLEEENAR